MKQKTEDIAIGIDFGGTSIKIAPVRKDQLLEEAIILPTSQYKTVDEALNEMNAVITSIKNNYQVSAVGIGLPGFVDFETGFVHQLTNVEAWKKVPLKQQLEALSALPVTVENDANCMMYAEWKAGAAQGMQHVIGVTLGTGVGGGLIVNGQLVRGSQFGAGEIGQMSIDYKGKLGNYGNQGALEKYVGIEPIMQQAQYLLGEKITPSELAALAIQGDVNALKVWNELADQLAGALMSIVWLLNPEAVVIGGGIAKAGDLLFQPLKQKMHDQLSAPFKNHLQIVSARFENEAGMIGAANLSLDQLKSV